MKSLLATRKLSHLSQRTLAIKAGISYKALQLIEKDGFSAKVSTLEKISLALHYPKKIFTNYISSFFSLPQDSIAIISRQIVYSKSLDWRIPFFNFVDQFRKSKDINKVSEPPCQGLSPKLMALLASTTEVLCKEMNLSVPWWCQGVRALQVPWFVAEVENLKAMSLVESPAEFRKRHIFVLANFLERA